MTATHNQPASGQPAPGPTPDDETEFPCICGQVFAQRWERESHWNDPPDNMPHGIPVEGADYSIIDVAAIRMRVDQIAELLGRKYPRAAKDPELGCLLDTLRDEIPPFGPQEDPETPACAHRQYTPAASNSPADPSADPPADTRQNPGPDIEL